MSCKLEKMFKLRNDFITEISSCQPGSYPSLPIDLKNKKSQQFCRDLALRGVEEMFEALQHLKNWKPHRVTEIDEDVDKDEFLEEIVDALNYFFSLLIATGIDENDLFDAYIKKHQVIKSRLKNGY